jgi:hypothetical protein
MQTGKNIATNNFIIRLWSCKHYGTKLTNNTNVFQGSIQEVKSGDEIMFNGPGDLLKGLEKKYKELEKEK